MLQLAMAVSAQSEQALTFLSACIPTLLYKPTWHSSCELIWKRNGEQYPILVFRLTTKEALYKTIILSEVQQDIAYCDVTVTHQHYCANGGLDNTKNQAQH